MDTRLEAKDTKNLRPRTAFPRTDTLGDKDTSTSALQKKIFTKIFQAITKKRFPKNFSGAPQNFNNSKNN